ncbi:predicted protein [Plenodomus lingam JN3]|uniref:Predicted protein n=1 Tax=Leptosphaeria maculans (strain JN3 / isolate v23.1.3 / race Av1-4-5-6-7-8) TaxID=985895 RepID=E4ZHP1_LEPMJ|nr:predicted protein [Plenodomus lingam JN3]CBX90874.1 predicted protein [Plenodomus lingam JN3]
MKNDSKKDKNQSNENAGIASRHVDSRCNSAFQTHLD